MTKWRWLYGFALPMGMTVVALAIALGLREFGVRQVFFLFLPAVMVSAWFGGRVGGIVASTLAVLFVAMLLQLPPELARPDDQGTLNLGEWLLLALFGAVCLSISLLTAGRHRADVERERALRDAQSARRDAEINSRLKDQFLATLSHELRTPLNAVLGWARMLSIGKLDAAKTAAALASIERNAQAQKQLVDDLLDVSAIVSGQMRLHPREIDLGEVVRTAVDSVRLSAEARHLHLEEHVEPVMMIGDADRLRQVVWNLMSNAVKFTPDGGDIVVQVSQEGPLARIAVRDTGRGIDAGFLPYVFQPFRQADSSLTRTSGGLGLGLSLVRHLVEGHGGTVAVSSDGLKQGATFVVSLPVQGSVSEHVRVVPRAAAGEIGDLGDIRDVGGGESGDPFAPASGAAHGRASARASARR